MIYPVNEEDSLKEFASNCELIGTVLTLKEHVCTVAVFELLYYVFCFFQLLGEAPSRSEIIRSSMKVN